MCKLKVILRLLSFPRFLHRENVLGTVSRVGSFKRNLSSCLNLWKFGVVFFLSRVLDAVIPCAWFDGHLKTWRLGGNCVSPFSKDCSWMKTRMRRDI